METARDGLRREGDESGPLERTLGMLISSLDLAGIPHMVTGGLAALAHGALVVVRRIEVAVALDPAELPRLLGALGSEFLPTVAAPDDFVRQTRTLPVESRDETYAEFLFAGMAFERTAIARARVGTLGAVTARVATPADLVLMKLASKDPNDREDVPEILDQIGAALDLDALDHTVEELSRDLGRPEMLTLWKDLRKGR